MFDIVIYILAGFGALFLFFLFIFLVILIRSFFFIKKSKNILESDDPKFEEEKKDLQSRIKNNITAKHMSKSGCCGENE
jgi:Co/Zn/Cd efflux system component